MVKERFTRVVRGPEVIQGEIRLFFCIKMRNILLNERELLGFRETDILLRGGDGCSVERFVCRLKNVLATWFAPLIIGCKELCETFANGAAFIFTCTLPIHNQSRRTGQPSYTIYCSKNVLVLYACSNYYKL
jgi:hypothetical protein